MRSVLAILLTVTVLLDACGPGVPERTTVRRTAPRDSEKQKIAAPDRMPVQPVPTQRETPSAPRPGEEAVSPDSTAAFSVVLEEDPSFLEERLPVSDENRYRKWKAQRVIRVGVSHLQHLVLLEGGRKVLTLSTMDNLVRVYDRKDGKRLAKWPVPDVASFGLGDITRWPPVDEAPLFLLAKQDGLWRCNALRGDMIPLFAEVSFRSLRWSPDERHLLAATANIENQTSQLFFFHRASPLDLDFIKSISFDERVEAWDLSRDNRYLAVVTYPSDTLSLIDLHNGDTLWRIPVPRYSGDVSFSPSGDALAVGGSALLLVDAENPARRTRYSHFQNNIAEVRFSPSGDAIAVASFDGKIRLFSYNMASLALSLIKTLAHSGSANVYRARFLDNGRGLASVSGDQTLRIWGTANPSRADSGQPGPVWRRRHFTRRDTAVDPDPDVSVQNP